MESIVKNAVEWKLQKCARQVLICNSYPNFHIQSNFDTNSLPNYESVWKNDYNSKLDR